MSDESHTLVQESFAAASDIQPIVARLEEALADSPKTHALISLTTLMILIQNPDLNADQIYEGVREVSRFTCLWLAGLTGDDTATGEVEVIDPKKLN